MKPDRVGVAIFTVKFAVIVADEYPGVAACLAVIIACPAFTMVTVLPDMSATATLLLVNVNVAAGLVLVDTGFVKSNGAVPYTRRATLKFVRTGVMVAISIHNEHNKHNGRRPRRKRLPPFNNQSRNCSWTNNARNNQPFINIRKYQIFV